jgi:pilus assembly protein CpaC
MAISSRTGSRRRAGQLAVLAALISFGVSGAKAQPVPAGQAAEPAPAQAGELPQVLHLLVGRSLVIASPTRIKRVSLADPSIAEAIVVSPNQVVLNGKMPGGVSLLIWDENEQTQNFEVSVDIDILGLQEKIHEEFPSEPVKLEGAGDVVMLSGSVSSPEVGAKILEFVKAATPKVTSLMQIPLAPTSDILLEVKFAEVDRTLLSQYGINFLLPGGKNIGSVSTQQFSPPGLASSSTSSGSSSTGPSTGLTNTFTLSDLLNIFIFRPDLNLGATIQALQEQNILEILAEPNLLTASGKEADFLAGGQFPYPVLQGTAVGGTAGITIQFKEYGIKLGFTPTMLSDGTIHLKVSPEVSSLDFTNAVTISGFTIPALSTQRVDSEMDLRDGQSFAIAGLINNQVTKELEKVPGIGDIPVLGKLFQSYSLNRSHSELLVVVTPHIVHALDPQQVPTGPAFPIPFIGNAPPEKTKGPVKQ